VGQQFPIRPRVAHLEWVEHDVAPPSLLLTPPRVALFVVDDEMDEGVGFTVSGVDDCTTWDVLGSARGEDGAPGGVGKGSLYSTAVLG
jgi:hypothetical protein